MSGTKSQDGQRRHPGDGKAEVPFGVVARCRYNGMGSALDHTSDELETPVTMVKSPDGIVTRMSAD